MKKKQSDLRADSNLELFPDLPLPPPAGEMIELRSLQHPVWTEHKAKLIGRYLQLFTYVTRHGTYIDGFAGQQNARALDGWAAKVVLSNQPKRLRRFYLCDNDAKQIKLLEQLRDEQPPRGPREQERFIEIIPGDFNLTVRDLLSRKLDAATFCLLDQRTFECKWSTVKALARHRDKPPKIELFYFLPIGWLNRAFVATTKNRGDIDDWWGGKDWEMLIDMKPHEKAIVFEDKLRNLGYRHVHAFPIFDHENGDRIMFYMILASDHPEAPKLMWRAYDQAVHDIPGWHQIDLLGNSE
jgi:three-Cys-motif partner protein